MLKWAKISKEVKKLCVIVVFAEFLLSGVVYYVCQNNTILGLFQTKTVYIEVVKAKTIEPTEKQSDSVVDKIVKYIHLKESTNGTAKAGLHKTCESKGLSNEYGYNPPQCYNSNGLVIELVKQFIEQRLAKGFSEQETLCIYNTGMSRSGDCDYTKDYE